MSEPFYCDSAECDASGDLYIRRFTQVGQHVWRCDDHLPGKNWTWDRGSSSAAIRDGAWADAPDHGAPTSEEGERVVELEAKVARFKATLDRIAAEVSGWTGVDGTGFMEPVLIEGAARIEELEADARAFENRFANLENVVKDREDRIDARGAELKEAAETEEWLREELADKSDELHTEQAEVKRLLGCTRQSEATIARVEAVVEPYHDGNWDVEADLVIAALKPPRTYTCAKCRKTFEYGWSEAQANAEAKELFGVDGASTNPDMLTVCDDCFKPMREDLTK